MTGVSATCDKHTAKPDIKASTGFTVDSGASSHVIHDISPVKANSYRAFVEPGHVRMGGGEHHAALGLVDVDVTLKDAGINIALHACLWVPSCSVNVISVSQAARVSGLEFRF
jgi:hypothetical protein